MTGAPSSSVGALVSVLERVDPEQLLASLCELGPLITPSPDAAALLAVRYVKHLVDSGRVGEARRFLDLIDSEGVMPSALVGWSDALRLPSARPGSRGTGADPTSNARWLRDHAHSYRGQWVALRQGALLGSGTSRRAVERRLRRGGGRVSFFRVPD